MKGKRAVPEKTSRSEEGNLRAYPMFTPFNLDKTAGKGTLRDFKALHGKKRAKKRGESFKNGEKEAKLSRRTRWS